MLHQTAGQDFSGQIDRAQPTAVDPTVVSLPSAASAVTAGFYHSCALVPGSAVFCWGRNDSGESGPFGGTAGCPRGPSTAAPAQPCVVTHQAVAQSGAFRSIGAGDNFTCGLTAAGTASCWGDNGFGQLGSAPLPSARCYANRFDATGPQESAPHSCSDTPVQVAIPSPRTFVSLAVGEYHVCGIASTDGALYCWGLNDSGQLGDAGTEGSSPQPVRVAEPSPTVTTAQTRRSVPSSRSNQRIRP